MKKVSPARKKAKRPPRGPAPTIAAADWSVTAKVDAVLEGRQLWDMPGDAIPPAHQLAAARQIREKAAAERDAGWQQAKDKIRLQRPTLVLEQIAKLIQQGPLGLKSDGTRWPKTRIHDVIKRRGRRRRTQVRGR